MAAGACASAGEWAGFQALIEEAVPLARLRFSLGAELAFDRNEFAEWSFTFKRGQLLHILGENPLSVELWLELGRISHNRGDLESATAAFQGALALDPVQAEALEFLAHQTRLTTCGAPHVS